MGNFIITMVESPTRAHIIVSRSVDLWISVKDWCAGQARLSQLVWVIY